MKKLIDFIYNSHTKHRAEYEIEVDDYDITLEDGCQNYCFYSVDEASCYCRPTWRLSVQYSCSYCNFPDKAFVGEIEIDQIELAPEDFGFTA